MNHFDNIMKWIPYKMLHKICIFPFCKFTKKNMGSILDKFSWVRNIGRQYLFSTKFWPGIFQKTFIFLHTKFGMLIVSESTTILVWKCVTTLRTPDIREINFFFISNISFQFFDFTFQGFLHCGISFPVHSQMSFLLAIYAQTQRKNYDLIDFTFNLFLWGGYHFQFTKHSVRKWSGVGGYYE